MKICLTTEHYPPHIGGIEIVFQEYAQRLARGGHQVRVITSNSGGLYGIHKINSNLSIHYIKCFSFFNHPIFPKKQLIPHIKWADVIHTTTLTAAVPTVDLTEKYNKPCILMVHEALFKKWFSVEKNPFKALAFLSFEWYVITKKYTLWQAISQSTKKDLLQYNISPKKIITIYHGIDYKTWNQNVIKNNLHSLLKVSLSKKIFLYNGRPGQTKGLFILLESIKKIHKQLPNKFVFGFILSKTPKIERDKFTKLVKEERLQHIIKISNPLPYNKLPGYRKSAFAIIIPSITEGFGFTVAETAALSVPMIVSNTGSIPEVASGKVLFFKNKNSADLAVKILLATKNKFVNIPSKKFNWNSTINKVEKTYKKVLNK